jgi:hypothetical protein
MKKNNFVWSLDWRKENRIDISSTKQSNWLLNFAEPAACLGSGRRWLILKANYRPWHDELGICRLTHWAAVRPTYFFYLSKGGFPVLARSLLACI